MTQQVIDPWDVLVVASWLVMQLVLDTRYTWPVVIATACICMRTRDLDAHEGMMAMYMLRHTCGAMHAPTAWLSAPVLLLGAWSRLKQYQCLDPLTRRACVLASAMLCLVLLHSVADAPWVACVRAVLYVATTRHACLHRADSWDAVAQSVWLLCVPPYALGLVVFQLNDALSIYPPRRRPSSCIWTTSGVSHEEV